MAMLSLCCDVGTGSVRVGIFRYADGGNEDTSTLQTTPIVLETEPIALYNPRPNFYEQRTSDIWTAFCKCTNKCLEKIATDKEVGTAKLKAMAFSATCSLVVVEEERADRNDVILWMDHRAVVEAQEITDSRHGVLKQFGGVCSPEFSIAKLVWLKRNEPQRFDEAKAFMELPDWMTYRCSALIDSPEAFPRSLCSVTCKWGYDAHLQRWPWDLLSTFGLDESIANKLGTTVHKPGLRTASLSFRAAQEIGLSAEVCDPPEVCLASALIDAHSGALAMMLLASRLDKEREDTGAVTYENIFSIIAGTSSCHMVLNREYLFTRGVWGPYLDVIVPGYYLREAGQSATGKLLEHMLSSYSKQAKPIEVVVGELNAQLKTVDLHHQTDVLINPTFHGNRSPIANPNMKGAIYGLSLKPNSLLEVYVATIEAIVYETSYIIEEIEKSSAERASKIRQVIVSGGLSLNEYFLQTAADILNVEVITFGSNSNLMLIGGAMIAFTAARDAANQAKAIDIVERINHLRVTHSSTQPDRYHPRLQYAGYHQRKYKAYRKLVDCCHQMSGILSGE